MASQKLYTVSEAAEILSLSAIRVRQFCQEGRIGQKHGPLWLISEAELSKFSKKKRPAGGKREKKDK